MSGYFLNTLVSAVVGILSAAGTTWYVSAQSDVEKSNGVDHAKYESLEVDSIVVHDSLTLIDSKTGETVVEIKNGEVFVQNGIYADHVAAYDVIGQKVQTTPDNPLNPNCSVFGEMSITKDGGGYLALLSPCESHSVTMGFDRSERGCIISKNNSDESVAAQAVFIRPSREARASGVAQTTPSEQTRAKETRTAILDNGSIRQ